MKQLPKLAIVGRPNVGKSALFNRICAKRISIVDEAEGVTRDRLYAKADIFGFPFEVIDTGGIDPKSPAAFNEHIKRQAEIAIEEADTIVMVVDGQVGPTALDREVAKILLRTKKPLCLAVNKIDTYDQEYLMHPFYSLGIKEIISVSATHNFHIAELLEASLSTFNRDEAYSSGPTSIQVAIIGRPNVGKSSLVNYLLNEDRCIVSPVPGTTRDSVDVTFNFEDQRYTLIDTAGIKRKSAEFDVVEKFAAIRTERAIERADICLLMLDSQQGVTAQEKRIAKQIEEAGKGCILLFNKWDLVKGFRMEHCMQGVEQDVPFLKHCPKIFISALTGRNVEEVFGLINQVYADSQKRITTGQLNKFIGLSLQKNHPPMIMGKRLRIYYMAQIGIQPPRFVVFVNNPTLMMESYKKYLYNQFRETYGFLGVPIELHLKGKFKQEAHERLAKKKDKHDDDAPESDFEEAEEVFDEGDDEDFNFNLEEEAFDEE